MSNLRFIRKLRFILPVVALAMLGIFVPSPVAAGTLSGDLNKILSLGGLLRVNVIVQTNGRPSSSLLSLVQLLGGKIYAQFDSINGFVVDSPLSLITTLLSRADVERICPDRKALGALDLS